MTPSRYEEFVALYANRELLRAVTVTDTADAVAIGSGEAETPRAWVDLLAESDEERGRWLNRENRRVP